ncbi:MAG: DUF4388 domain-containing protein [Chloroflexi bacterium]|nr:DUF4388 domain-containing protein [Chloroflexota bacterium]
MALKGDLRDFSTTQLLNLINLARKTGTLSVDAGDGHAHLYFKEGKLIYATTNGQNGHLVTALRGAGKLSEKEAQALQSQAGSRSDRELGVLLINAGRLNRAEIEAGIHSFVLNNVYRLFTWTEGAFLFEPTLQGMRDRIPVVIPLENVIVEGSRRIKEWERLQEELPDLDRALKFADRPGANVRNISLSIDEWRVISFINPRNTIRQIAQHNSMSDLQIRRIVYSLLQAGLVELIPLDIGRSPQPPVLDAAVEETTNAPTVAPPKVRRPAVKRNVILRLIDRIREL